MIAICLLLDDHMVSPLFVTSRFTTRLKSTTHVSDSNAGTGLDGILFYDGCHPSSIFFPSCVRFIGHGHLACACHIVGTLVAREEAATASPELLYLLMARGVAASC